MTTTSKSAMIWTAVLLLIPWERAEARPALLLQQEIARRTVRQQARTMLPVVLQSRRTLEARSLRQLIQWTAPVARDAPLRYVDFEAYWLAANRTNQRTGKAFEAVLAWRANKTLKAFGNQETVLVTAAEGFFTTPEDLVQLGSEGQRLARYQAKLRLSLRSASRFLADPRYEGQFLVTTRESLADVERQLWKREANALRRSIELAPKWQRVRDALDNGRLMRTWAGKPLPTFKGLEQMVKSATKEEFANAETQFARKMGSAAERSSLTGGRVLTKAFFVADVAFTGYLEFHDIERYSRGQIGGDYLAIKSGIRGTQLAWASYALVTPEPASKAVAAVVVVTLVVVDVGTDLFYEGIHQRRENAARDLLATIGRKERYHAVRARLVSLAASNN